MARPVTTIANALFDSGGALYDAESSRYGLRWDGLRDDGPALQALLDEVGERGGGVVLLPRLTGKVNTPLRIRHSDVHVMGKGDTVINFDPPSPGTMFRIEHHANTIIARCSVSRIAFLSPANRIAKTAFDVVDSTMCFLEHLTCVEGNWDSRGGIGFRFRGREFTRLGPHVTMATENPIVFDPNPNYPAIGNDHFTWYGPVLLIGRGTAQNPALQNRPIVAKNAGSPTTSMRVVGTISMNRGSQGWRYRAEENGVTDANIAHDIDLTGFRREQPPMVAEGRELYAMDFDAGGKQLFNLTLGQGVLSGAVVDGRSKGIRLVGVKGARIGPMFYSGPYAALELGPGCDDIRWDNFWCPDRAVLLNSGGLVEVASVYPSAGGTFPFSGHFVAQAALPNATYTVEEQQKPQSEGGVYHARRRISNLASKGRIRLPVNIHGANKLMRLTVSAVGRNGALYQGTWILGTAGAVLLPGSTNADQGTGSLLGVEWGQFRSSIYNGTGQPMADGFYTLEMVV